MLNFDIISGLKYPKSSSKGITIINSLPPCKLKILLKNTRKMLMKNVKKQKKKKKKKILGNVG